MSNCIRSRRSRDLKCIALPSDSNAVRTVLGRILDPLLPSTHHPPPQAPLSITTGFSTLNGTLVLQLPILLPKRLQETGLRSPFDHRLENPSDLMEHL